MSELMGPASGGTAMLYAVGRGLSLLPLFKEKEAHAYGHACPALRPRNDTFWLPRPMLIRSFIMECRLNETLSTRISCVDRLSRGFLRAFQVLPTAALQLPHPLIKAQESMSDAPYLVTQAYKAIPGFSSKGGEFSYRFFFLGFLARDKEILFRAEYDPFSKNSKAVIESA